MKDSVILQTAGRFLISLILLYSVFLFIRGHQATGGGFAGGLTAASAWGLYSIAYGVDDLRRTLRVRPVTLIGVGLLLALVSGLPSLLDGEPFLTGEWFSVQLGPERKWKLGTPLLFDLGVYITVVGSLLLAIMEIEGEDQEGGH